MVTISGNNNNVNKNLQNIPEKIRHLIIKRNYTKILKEKSIENKIQLILKNNRLRILKKATNKGIHLPMRGGNPLNYLITLIRYEQS